jgi:nitrogenase molybdenum-iron protein NifN
VAALATLCERSQPRIIALMSSGLSEAQGAEMTRALKSFRQQHPKYERVEIIHLTTPDFYGSLENGYATLVESLIEQLVPPQTVRSVRKKRVNLLLSTC